MNRVNTFCPYTKHVALMVSKSRTVAENAFPLKVAAIQKENFNDMIITYNVAPGHISAHDTSGIACGFAGSKPNSVSFATKSSRTFRDSKSHSPSCSRNVSV